MKEKYIGLKELNLSNLHFNEAMKNHTTFKIGGPADVLVDISSEEELLSVLKYARENDIDYFLMGNGSNLLVSDEGIRKLVIKISDKFNKIEIDSNKIIVESGALLSTISKKALKASLEGFEFASGIPGTVGGAITMNAGAYGGEMKDIVKRVKVVDKNNQIRYIDNKDMNFRYRGSKVVDEGLIVLGVEFELEHGDYDEIKANLKDLTERRTSKQPLEYASGGSTFKRPEGYYAGKLIDDSGLRGMRFGDAQVSEKHCGFVINRGNASFEEVMTLINFIKETVKSKFGVSLETEIKIID